METILIELTNQKAYRLLKELEDLKLIRVIKTPTKISALRKKIKTPMAETEIDKQLSELRSDWHRDI